VSYFKSTPDLQEELSISQIQEWLQQRSQEIVEKHTLIPLVKEHARILEDKRWALEVQLDTWLRKVRLHPEANEIIPLFRETRQVLDLLHFSAQPVIGEVLMANQEMEQRLHKIIEKLEASGFMDDFSFLFEKSEAPSEANPLLLTLLDLDALRKKLDQTISESQYHTVQVISSKADYLQKLAVHLQRFNKEAELKKSRQHLSEQKKLEKEAYLQQLRSDKKNLDLSDLSKQKKELQEQLEEKEMEILSFFSKVKPLLQQYKELEPSNGLLFSYIKDPLSSFLQDEGLFVVDILKKITALLREGKLSLSQDTLLSSISALEGIYNQRLPALKEEFKQLEKELRELNSHIHHNFFVTKVDDAAYRLEHYDKQAQKLQDEITVLTGKITKLQNLLAREKEELQSLIKSSLNRTVMISI